MHALIIDDSRATRTILCRIVSALGFEASEAQNGAEGLGVLMTGEFDFCLVDWNMPKMNGPEFIKQVKGDERFKSLPLILVTDEYIQSKIDEAMAAGADGYLEKPFAPEDLATLLERFDLRAA